MLPILPTFTMGFGESVVADSVVENGGELLADRVQVGLRIFEPVAGAHGHELVFQLRMSRAVISFTRLFLRKSRVSLSIMFAFVSWAVSAADDIMRQRTGNAAVLFAQIGYPYHPCPANCSFCSFAKDDTQMDAFTMSDEDIAAIKSFTQDSNLYGLWIMAMADYDIKDYLRVIRLVRETAPACTNIYSNRRRDQPEPRHGPHGLLHYALRGRLHPSLQGQWHAGGPHSRVHSRPHPLRKQYRRQLRLICNRAWRKARPCCKCWKFIRRKDFAHPASATPSSLPSSSRIA